jgi:hypothetical protein
MTPHELLNEAKRYARPLIGEIEDDNKSDRQASAMRALVYHCAAAITTAIVDHMNSTKR